MPLKSRQLEAMIAERSRKTGSEVDQMMRRLREAGRLTAGPRGNHAPPVTPEIAAQVIATVCGAARPGDAVPTWSALYRSVSADGRRFLAVLTEALEAGAHDVAHVLIWVDSFNAEIKRQDGRCEVFTKAGDEAPERAFSAYAREIAFIGGKFLRDVAEALK